MQEFRKGGRRDGIVDITLHEFCKDWLSSRKSELRPKSIEAYENTIIRLEEYFGKDASLRSIEPQKAAVFVSQQKYKAKGHEGNELSDSSREQIKRNCKCIFNSAVDWGLLASNPFKSLRLKKLPPKHWYRIRPKEYHALLEVVSLRERAAYALLYTAGLRMSEAFSLMWSNVDFESGKLIVVNREATATLPPFHIKDHEARRIPLPRHTIDLLTKWQAKAHEGVPYILLTKERFEIRERNAVVSKILASRRSLIYNYVINQYYQLKFSGISDDIFTRIRERVDQRIGKLLPESVRKFSAVYENLQSDNPENWSNAVHSCRRILEDLANAVFPPSEDIIKNIDGKEITIKLGKEQYINRILTFIDQNSSSKRFKELVGSNLKFIEDLLKSIFKATQKGSHTTIMSREEADRYVVYTYLIIGDIISLKKDK